MFGGEVITLGKTEHRIEPMSIEAGIEAGQQIWRIDDELIKEGCGFKDITALIKSGEWPAKVPAFISVLILKVPSLCEALTGIHRDSLKKLPVPILIELFVKAVQVNVKSLEGLEKNWGEAVGQMVLLGIHLMNLAGESQTSFVSSCETDGQEEKSEKQAPAKSGVQSAPPSLLNPENSKIWKR
jgi:hypothetical protein